MAAKVNGITLSLKLKQGSKSRVGVYGSHLVEGTQVTIVFPAGAGSSPMYQWTGVLKKPLKSGTFAAAVVTQQLGEKEPVRDDTGGVTVTVGDAPPVTAQGDIYNE